ncbi:hypothetical protein L7F22_003330 [Adiantum nelumboides]|nr:hypothetical protein [Adiantum nelumboides]
MAPTDFFKSYQDQMPDLLDPLLLLKASQDKRFVCKEAEKALIAMTSWISPNPFLLKLQPCLQHRNPKMRAKASSCVCRSVSRLGTKGIKDFGLETLIRMGASQLNDQLSEARASTGDGDLRGSSAAVSHSKLPIVIFLLIIRPKLPRA